MSIISNLIKKSLKRTGPLNILSFWYDGRFDLELLETGHNFFGALDCSAYPWPGFEKATYPNLNVLPNLDAINSVDLDLIIFNHREAHNKFFHLPKAFHVPALIIDHDKSAHNDFIIRQIKAQTNFDSVACQKEAQAQYDNKRCINYGIEKTIGQYDKDIDILISGKFTEQDMFMINGLKRQFPTLRVIGNNPQLPYAELVPTFEDYKRLFKRAKVFLNLSVQPTISYEILWALNSQCAIITHNFPIYKNLLINNENALILDKIEELVPAIQNLVHNKQAFQKLTSYTADLSEYNKGAFLDQWKEVLESYRYRIYMP